MKQPRVCVIGAGPCGLTALKNLRAAGLTEIVCYDENEAIGGNWVFTDDPGRMSVYESTHIISSTRLSEFEDFPMPTGYPDFPSHRQLRAYFDSYAAHFDVLRFVRLKTRVEAVRLQADGTWAVRAKQPDGVTEETFDYLLLCSGHHREPFIPNYPGKFTGEILHSAAFKRPDLFRGKRVLVVGAGNSGCDIAVETARVAAHTSLSVRRGYYIVPKVIFGRPVDVLYARARRRLPKALLQPVFRWVLGLAIGRYEKYGLLQPQCRPFEQHPTLNSQILDALRHGMVTMRPAIARLDGREVRFDDGSIDTFDTIIWATGFRTAFPFLDPSLVDWNPAEPPPLYLKMMHLHVPSLFFIGLFQPIGCIWRLADHQARIAALQIVGRLDRPTDLAARVSAEMQSPHWHFDRSPRHALEVDAHDFRRELLQELRRSA